MNALWGGNCILQSEYCPRIIPILSNVQDLFSRNCPLTCLSILEYYLSEYSRVLSPEYCLSILEHYPPKQLRRVSGRRSPAVTASKLSKPGSFVQAGEAKEKESSGQQPVLHLFRTHPSNPMKQFSALWISNLEKWETLKLFLRKIVAHYCTC